MTSRLAGVGTTPSKCTLAVILTVFASVSLVGAGVAAAGAPPPIEDRDLPLTHLGSTSVGDIFWQTEDEVTASFDWEPEEPFAGEEVTFDASDSSSPNGEIVEYNWDFGDGTHESTTDPEISHTYDESDDYRVVLQVVDEDDESARTAESLTVQEPGDVSAEVTHEPSDPTAHQPVTFDASESSSENGEIVEYRWYLGDGTQENTTDPLFNHTFEEEGGSYVHVEVVDEIGQTDSDAAEFYVSEAESPEAALSHSPTGPVEGEEVTFDGSDSTSPNGDIVEYHWEFGDGTVETTSSPTVTHSYDEVDGYPVTLEVTDEAELTDTAETTVRVQEAGTPMAVIDYSPPGPVTGETVSFDASDSTSPNGDIETYHWEFGDGTTATTGVPTVSHTYTETGAKLVTLEIVDEVGETDSTGTEFFVEQAGELSAAFTYTPDEPTVDETVTFDASDSVSPGEIVEYRWDFDGDNAIDETTGNPETTHTYTETGYYDVTLTIEDDQGDTDSTSQRLQVTAEMRCTVSATEIRPGEEITISAPDGDTTVYQFRSSGDGNWSDVQGANSTTVTYNETGEYRPAVRVFDDRTGEETVLECPTIDVEEEGEPLIPFDRQELLLFGGLLLGGLGLGYGAFRYRRPPGLPPGTSADPRYDTGLIEVDPGADGILAVTGLDFEPDLVLLSTTHPDQAEGARTVAWSSGTAVRTADGIDQTTMAVADDGTSTERGTCEASRDAVLDVVVHGDRSIGRLTGRLESFTGDGFELAIESTGEASEQEPFDVLYQAFATGDELSMDAGRVRAGSEPGPYSIPLDVDPSVVRLQTSTAVGESGTTLTTDRTVGLTTGAAVTDAGSVTQGGVGGVATPRRSRAARSSCGDDHVVALAHLDGDRVAGRTRATVTGLDGSLGIHFERAYSGPHKIDPTGDHPIDYLAIDAGELTPAVGTIDAPAIDEERSVDLAFEPGLVEVVTVQSGPDGEMSPPTGIPLGWSHGTAIVRDDDIDQYIVDGTRTAPEPADGTPLVATVLQEEPAVSGVGIDPSAGPSAEVATDGGAPTLDPRGRYSSDRSSDGQSAVTLEDRLPVDLRGALETSPALDDQPGGEPASAVPEGPRQPASDQIGVGVSLSEDGEIVGRRELSVTEMTESGFTVAADGVRTEPARADGAETKLWYIAWPSLEGSRLEAAKGYGKWGAKALTLRRVLR